MPSRTHIRRFSKEAAAGSIDREINIWLGDRAATFNVPVYFSGRSHSRVMSARLLNRTAIAAAAGNNWTFQLTNRGTAGAGVGTLCSVPADTATAAVAAYVAYDLAVDQNQELAINELLSFNGTVGAGNPDDLADAVLQVTVRSDL